jgi:hypothetical protein
MPRRITTDGFNVHLSRIWLVLVFQAKSEAVGPVCMCMDHHAEHCQDLQIGTAKENIYRS